MEVEKIHVFARSLLSTHGDKAELEAAQKALDCDRHGHKEEAENWRRIQVAIKEMRGPHVSLQQLVCHSHAKKEAGGLLLTAQRVTH